MEDGQEIHAHAWEIQSLACCEQPGELEAFCLSGSYLLPLEWWPHPPGWRCVSGRWERTRGLMKMGRKALEWLIELLGANSAATGASLPLGLGCACTGTWVPSVLSTRSLRACIQKPSRKCWLAAPFLFNICCQKHSSDGCPSLGPPACSGINRAGTTLSLTSLGTQEITPFPSPWSRGHTLPRSLFFSDI